MIHKENTGNYISLNVSNGRVYFYSEQVSHIEVNNNSPDTTIHMRNGELIYTKDNLETILNNIYSDRNV